MPLSIFSVYWNRLNVDVSPNLEHSRSPHLLLFEVSTHISATSSQPCLGLPRPSGHQQDDSTQGLDTQIGWSTNRRVEDLEKKSQQILLQGTWEEPDVCWESLLQTDTELSGKILTDRVSDDRPVFIYLRKGSVPWVSPTCRGVVSLEINLFFSFFIVTVESLQPRTQKQLHFVYRQLSSLSICTKSFLG